MTEIPEKPWKTLEFPYGSSSEKTVSGLLGSVRSCPDTTVIEPDSVSFGGSRKQCLFSCFRVTGVCQRKGSSHSGFSLIFFTLFGNRPFSRISPDPVSKGSGSGVPGCQKGPDPGQKGPEYSPSEALEGLRDLSNGDLDLSNTCPW